MPLLKIQQLIKRYTAPGGEAHTVLDVPEFTLDAGQHVALRGVSGTGKTTFLNCIAGILRPDQGDIELAGQNIAVASEGHRDQLRARHIGYIFQTFNLLQGYTCLENVLLGMSFSGQAKIQAAAAILKRVGLSDRMDYRPSELSVGQQQRVAVARALANRPQLVLADEPTGNLDEANGAAVMDLLFGLRDRYGATLIMVTHAPELATRCDRVVRLRDGHLLDDRAAHEAAE